MSPNDPIDRRMIDAEWKGRVTTLLESIDQRLAVQNGRLNNHAERISKLEHWRSGIVAVGTAICGVLAFWRERH